MRDDVKPEVFEQYQSFVIERHRMWERRMAGEESPWTTDTVLQQYSFCNMFRVLDAGSQFVMKELMYGDDLDEVEPVDTFVRAFLYRNTNTPEGWSLTRQELGRYPTAEDVLNGSLTAVWDTLRERGVSLLRRAYLVGRIPPGSSNQRYTIERLKDFIENRPTDLDEFLHGDVARRVEMMTTVPSFGTFLAQQIVTDFHYGPHGGDYENRVVFAGPGSIRGTEHLTGRSTEARTVDLIHELRDWWAEAEDSPEIPIPGSTPRRLSLMDVQNSLCEFDKYRKATQGYSRLRAFRPTHQLDRGIVMVPHHWG